MPRKKFDIAKEFNTLAHKSIVVTEITSPNVCEKVKNQDGTESFEPMKRYFTQNKRASIGRDEKNKTAVLNLSNNATRLFAIIQYNIPLNSDRITFNISKLKELLRIKSLNTIRKLFIELEISNLAKAINYTKTDIAVLINIAAIFFGANEAIHYLSNRTEKETSEVKYTPSKKRTRNKPFLIHTDTKEKE